MIHDPHSLAEMADLRHVTDAMPGIRRKKRGRGFIYIDARGRTVTDLGELQRFAALAIPPAWTDVWICPLRHGHLQATGRDDKGRKQYRYHPQWTEQANQTKFDGLLAFAETLPRIRARVARDLRRGGWPKEKVVATVVQLLDRTLIRVGNEEYARQNDSFGLTTLRDGHVKIVRSLVRFRFRGKSGVFHEVELKDRRLARLVQGCQDIPGQELFQYETDDGEYQPIESADVNAYLREISGEIYTAKDFRTWRATALMLDRLLGQPEEASPRQRKQIVTAALCEVSKTLGNTRTVCKSYYVHPRVSELYLSGALATATRGFRARRLKWMENCEQCLVFLLKKEEKRVAA